MPTDNEPSLKQDEDTKLKHLKTRIEIFSSAAMAGIALTSAVILPIWNNLSNQKQKEYEVAVSIINSTPDTTPENKRLRKHAFKTLEAHGVSYTTKEASTVPAVKENTSEIYDPLDHKSPETPALPEGTLSSKPTESPPHPTGP